MHKYLRGREHNCHTMGIAAYLLDEAVKLYLRWASEVRKKGSFKTWLYENDQKLYYELRAGYGQFANAPNEIIKLAILKLHKEGFDLSASNVQQRYPGLYRTFSKLHPRRWERALETMGIELSGGESGNTTSRLGEKLRRAWIRNETEIPTWSKNRVIYEIIAHHKRGFDLSKRAIEKLYPELYYNARKLFGTWKAAVTAAWLYNDEIKELKNVKPSPEEKRRRTWMLKEQPQEWSKNRVIYEIQAHHKRGFDLRKRAIGKLYPELYHNARRLFGTWEKAVTAAWLNYDEIKEPETEKNLAKENVISLIQIRHKSGLNMSEPSIVKKENNTLYKNAVRLFDSWENALAAAGLNYKEILQRDVTLKEIQRNAELTRKELNVPLWTKQRIIYEIAAHWKIGFDLGYANIGRQYLALSNAAVTRFGSWRAAVEAAGLYYVLFLHKKGRTDVIVARKIWAHPEAYETLLRLVENRCGIGEIMKKFRVSEDVAVELFCRMVVQILLDEKKVKGAEILAAEKNDKIHPELERFWLPKNKISALQIEREVGNNLR